jgi:Na+/H+ antiporter NhaD/arsenite permease-like protein
MNMFTLMIVIFVLGYIAIAFEHHLKVDKAVSALAIGTLCWVAYMFGLFDILTNGLSLQFSDYIRDKELLKDDSSVKAFLYGLQSLGGDEKAAWLKEMREWLLENQIIPHLGEIAGILFFLLGAMTIVEVIDQHEGFRVLTDRIRTVKKVKLLWIISIMTFFLSAVLDNLTTTIVMIALIRKLISDKQTRWLFASIIVLAANAGGAWSPIGDITTIMLWIGEQVTTGAIISRVLIPSLAAILVPLAVMSFFLKGAVKRPATDEIDNQMTTKAERLIILGLGVGGLLFVPVFKTITHLPPYMGMLFSLSILWLVTELMHKNKDFEIKSKLRIVYILKRVEMPTVFFFLGILLAVAALQSAGQLNLMSEYLNENIGNVFLIDIAIGLISAVVDNVPLVAGAMGMYPVEAAGATGFSANFVQNGTFWELLAYTAGTGGSVLIVGSAAGVAAMGLEKIDFIWYLKKISLLALLGYFAGAGIYYIQMLLIAP